MRLEDIRFDEADKMIKMQGIQYLLFEGLPTETEPGSAPPPQKVAVPFSLAIAMPAKYMHDVEAPPGEMTAMQATRMLVAMASTEANPGGTVKDVAPGDQVILKQKIATALSLREDTLTNMLSALIFAVQPEYHIYTRVSLMRIGPYDLFAENFHFSLRDKQYFPRVEKVGLSLERNPVAEYNFPGIMPAEIVLSPKSTLNQGISVAGRVTFVGNGVTLSVPDVCDMTIDSQTEIVFNMPETTLSVRNFLCDRRKPGKKIVRASFGVRFLPFALIENTIPGYTDATIVAGKILGIETVFDHIRYNNASKNLEISGNLVVPQDRYSLARIPGLLPKPVIPFSWSRRVPNTIAADERREKALSDVLGYIRTKENALRKDDEAMYSLEEGLRILSWTNGSPDQLMEHIGRLLVGSQVVELPVCSQNKADNMVRLTDIKASNEGSGLAENPAVILSIHAACPTLTTDGTFDGTNIHFAGFSLKPVTGIDMVRFPKNEIFSLKNVTFSRAGLDMSQAVAEISSVELHDGKMEIASMGSFSLNMTDSTVRLRSLRVTLDKPLQGVDVAMNNVLFYDKLAKFVDNSLKQFSLDLTISFSPRVCIQDVSFGPQFDNISPTKLKLLELLGDVNLRLSSTTGSTTQCGKLAFLQNDRYQDTEPMKKVTLKVTDYDKTPIIGAQVSVRGTAFRYAAPAVGGSADQIPRGLVALPAGQMNVFGQEGAMEEVQGKTDAAGLITFDLKPGRYNFEVLAENYDSMEQSTDQFVADAAPKGASSILTVKTGLVDATTKTTYGDQWIVGNRSWAGQRFLMNVKMLKADAALSEVKITVTDVLDGAPISGATVELKSAAGRYVLRQIGDIGGVAKSGVYYGLVPRFHAYKISIVADGYHVIGQAVTFDADEGKTEEILNVHGPQRTWQYTMVSNAKTGMRFKIRDFGFSPVTGAKLTLRKNNKVLYTFFEELDDAKKPTAYYTCVASQRNPGPCNGVENGVYQLVVEKAGYKPYSGDYQTVNVNGYPVFREIMIEALPPE